MHSWESSPMLIEESEDSDRKLSQKKRCKVKSFRPKRNPPIKAASSEDTLIMRESCSLRYLYTYACDKYKTNLICTKWMEECACFSIIPPWCFFSSILGECPCFCCNPGTLFPIIFMPCCLSPFTLKMMGP